MTKRSLLAVASLTCALLFFFPPAWAAAVVLGVVALVEIAQAGGQLRGRGLAITGIVLGCAWTVVLVILVVTGLRNFQHTLGTAPLGPLPAIEEEFEPAEEDAAFEEDEETPAE